MRGRVLVVDDDSAFRETLVASLDAEGFATTGATSAAEALQRVVEHARFEAVLTDIRMHGMTGIDLCRQINDARPEVPIVIMTAFGDLEAAVAAIRAGAYDFLAKPFETEQLMI